MFDDVLGYLFSAGCIDAILIYLLPVGLLGLGVYLMLSHQEYTWGGGCIAAAIVLGTLIYRQRSPRQEL